VAPASDQGLAVSHQRYQVIPRVLVFVRSDDKVLLLKGAPDKKIWPGKYNGLGGHVERGEGVHGAARREVLEESGLQVSDLALRGIVTVDAGDAGTGVLVFVFTAVAAESSLAATVEGSLSWVPLEAVSAVDVVEDVPILLRRITAQPPEAPPFSAAYSYDPSGEIRIVFDDESL
jgi:8-oxo-dGTP diphosphatase